MTKKHYYAEYCPFGLKHSYGIMDGNAYSFYQFDSKAERDAWVDEHYLDDQNNFVAGEITRKKLEWVLGKDFEVVDNGPDPKVCVKHDPFDDIW